jgi:hypothetical protein
MSGLLHKLLPGNRVCPWKVVLALSFTSLGFPAQVLADVRALFDLSTPATSPFPSDWFTVPDASHNTRRRVNVPLPECALRPSDCEDLNVINMLDGLVLIRGSRCLLTARST